MNLVLALGFAAVATSARGDVELHVAPHGLDSAPGTFDNPLRTPHAARDALRSMKRSAAATVHIHGHHRLASTLRLDERDHDTTWSGVGTAPRMSGGIAVPFTAFSPAAVPSGAKGVVKADLFALGFNVSSLGAMGNPHPDKMAELFVEGQPMTLSRSPNIADDGTWMWYGYEHVMDADNFSSFVLDDAASATALRTALDDASEGELWLHGYWKFDWRDTFVNINSVAPTAGNASRFTFNADPKTPPQYPFTNGCRFYGVNSLAFLDAPGEYYINRPKGELYFLPVTPLTASSDVVVSHLETVVDATNAVNVRFEKLTISDSRGNVFDASSGSNITVDSCTVSNGGGTCIEITGNRGSSVTNSKVWGCGLRGIGIACGDTATLEHGNCRVVGNEISNFSRIVRTYQPAVGFSGVGHYIANNTATNGPHTAMQGSCNDCIFEFNSISHMCFECTDTGAFYVGRSWSQRGNVARYNVFDTIRPTERLAQKSCSQNAFYLDDQMSGWEFYGNTIRNATVGFLLGGGRRNLIHDNYFENNDNDIHFDNRGMNWQLDYCSYNCSGGHTPAGQTQKSCFKNELNALHYSSPPYATHYPELVNIFDDTPCVPTHNRVENNTYCHARSAGGGKFIDRNASVIEGWHSTLLGNIEHCRPERVE